MTTDKAYQQLATRLVSDIAAGRYPVGARLPTEAELCGDTGLSRGTVRQALREVQELGMISRRPRHGSQVLAVVPVEDYQPIAGSPDDIKALVERTKILRPVVRDVVADKALAQRLGARIGSAWHLIEGPRVLRDRREPPVCWSEQYLRVGSAGFDILKRGDFTVAQIAAYDIEQTISAAALDPQLAMTLGTVSTVALVVTRRQLDRKGRPLSVGIHTHPADRYQFRTVIGRRG